MKILKSLFSKANNIFYQGKILLLVLPNFCFYWKLPVSRCVRDLPHSLLLLSEYKQLNRISDNNGGNKS